MFAYCLNSPVNKTDVNGAFAASAVLYAALITMICGVVIVCLGEIVITTLIPALQEGAGSLYDSISGSIDKAKDKAKDKSKSPSIDNKKKQNYFLYKNIKNKI